MPFDRITSTAEAEAVVDDFYARHEDYSRYCEGPGKENPWCGALPEGAAGVAAYAQFLQLLAHLDLPNRQARWDLLAFVNCIGRCLYKLNTTTWMRGKRSNRYIEFANELCEKAREKYGPAITPPSDPTPPERPPVTTEPASAGDNDDDDDDAVPGTAGGGQVPSNSVAPQPGGGTRKSLYRPGLVPPGIKPPRPPRRGGKKRGDRKGQGGDGGKAGGGKGGGGGGGGGGGAGVGGISWGTGHPRWPPTGGADGMMMSAGDRSEPGLWPTAARPPRGSEVVPPLEISEDWLKILDVQPWLRSGAEVDWFCCVTMFAAEQQTLAACRAPGLCGSPPERPAQHPMKSLTVAASLGAAGVALSAARRELGDDLQISPAVLLSLAKDIGGPLNWRGRMAYGKRLCKSRHMKKRR